MENTGKKRSDVVWLTVASQSVLDN